jgi:nucleotide-binding universal stress UspA family protein
MGTIVVGVDGSYGSRRALEWAIDEARRRSDELIAVHAWSLPIVVGTFEAVIPVAENVDFQKEAEGYLERTVKEVAGGDPDVPIRLEATQRPAASALVHASRDAELLVVGSRGFGGFRGLLLGSVGQQCAQHSHCPVVIVPHEERKAS